MLNMDDSVAVLTVSTQIAILTEWTVIHVWGRDLRIVFFRSNRISNRIGHPIRFRIEYSNRIGRITQAVTKPDALQAYRVQAYNMLTTSIVNERE